MTAQVPSSLLCNNYDFALDWSLSKTRLNSQVCVCIMLHEHLPGCVDCFPGSCILFSVTSHTDLKATAQIHFVRLAGVLCLGRVCLSTAGMAEILLPGLMPEEWRALVAACWATKPQDRPTVSHLQHQISSLQHSLRAVHAATGQKRQLASPASRTGITAARDQAASSDTAAAGGASQSLGLPKLLQGLDQWMPVPSVVYSPIDSEQPTSDEQSVQGGDSTVVATEGASEGGIAAVHGGRLPPRRGDSARDSFWSWKAGLQGGPGAIRLPSARALQRCLRRQPV